MTERLIVDQLPATPNAQTPPRQPQISPWEQAQIEQAREAAKAALDSILETQFTLQELGVADWAGDQFDSALSLAREGDQAYRSQEFIGAEAAYLRSGEILNNLLASAASVYERELTRGSEALAAGDAKQATDAYSLALRIRPEDEAAALGLERAAVLDQVLADTSAGEQALRSQNLDEALALFEHALSLDPDHQAAREGVQRTRSLKTKNRFGAAMSQGYSALNAGNYSRAREQFSKASKLSPGSTEAGEAIAQVDAAITLQRIDGLLTAGEEAAAGEDWNRAVEQFGAALTIDPSLVRAQEAFKNAETRQRLDKVLQDALDQPLTLVDQSRYDTTLGVLRNASTLDDRGPRLSDQLQRLAKILRHARTPISVAFASDNQTDVNLLRVRRLGKFQSTNLDLNPGTYVVVGRRNGFRDVRHEFVLEPGKRPPSIEVRCTEPI